MHPHPSPLPRVGEGVKSHLPLAGDGKSNPLSHWWERVRVRVSRRDGLVPIVVPFFPRLIRSPRRSIRCERRRTACAIATCLPCASPTSGRLAKVAPAHAVFRTPWAGNPRVNIQNHKGQAKAYQVRQVLQAIDRLQEETQRD